MSLTFYIASEEIVLRDNKVVVQYTMLHPQGFDHDPVIHSKCCLIGPPNPWKLEVSDDDFTMLADLLAISYEAK
jgi:hypothetical protein